MVNGYSTKLISGDLTPSLACQFVDGLGFIMRNHPEMTGDLAGWRVSSTELSKFRLYQLLSNWEKFEPVIWRTDLWNAAIRGADAFDRTRFSIPAHFKSQIWLPSLARSCSQEERKFLELDVKCDFVGLIVSNVIGIKDSISFEERWEIAKQGFIPSDAMSGRIGIQICLIFQSTTEVGGIRISGDLPRLRFIPTLYEGQEISASIYGATVAQIMFMGLEIVKKERVDLPRPERRRMLREGRQPPTVNVISLRREEAAQKACNKDGGSRLWNWQWLVGSHWRKQWYSKQGEHRPAFIGSYIKGPKDKPLKPPIRTIFDVRR